MDLERELAEARAEIERLKAYQVAIASEFPSDHPDGPDVARIIENIRALKEAYFLSGVVISEKDAEVQRLKECFAAHVATTEEKALIAYQAYGEKTDWKNFRGDPMPQFADLPELIQAAWRAAAGAVERAPTEAKTIRAQMDVNLEGKPILIVTHPSGDEKAMAEQVAGLLNLWFNVAESLAFQKKLKDVERDAEEFKAIARLLADGLADMHICHKTMGEMCNACFLLGESGVMHAVYDVPVDPNVLTAFQKLDMASQFVLEEDHERCYRVTLDKMVQSNGNVRWAIRRDSGSVLNRDLIWEWEPRPSSRTEEFFQRCRYDSFEEALATYRAWEAQMEKEREAENGR